MSSSTGFGGTASSGWATRAANQQQDAEYLDQMKKGAWASEAARREREGLPPVEEKEKRSLGERVFDKLLNRREKGDVAGGNLTPAGAGQGKV